MKKVVSFISIVFVFLLFYLTKGSDLLTLTMSFSLYILIGSIFSTININKDNFKLFKVSLLFILIIGLPLIIVSYFIGDILNINKLNIINIIMVVSLLCRLILKLINGYLGCINYKKLKDNLLYIFDICTFVIKILLIFLLFGIFKIDSNISIMFLYLTDIFVFVVFIIFLYFLVVKNIKNSNKVKFNNVKDITNIFVSNKVITVYNLINCSYIYTSVIILYYVLSNKYNYSYNDVCLFITNTYLYGLIFIYVLYNFIKRYLNINVKNKFNDNINKILKLMLLLMIFLTVISKPISYVVFGSDYNFFVNLVPVLCSFIFYDFVINTNINYNKEKNIFISLGIGLIVKLVFELPMINAVYRMGYSLIFGSLLSIMFGLIVSSFIGIFLIKNKMKLNLLENFNNILNIIYESILYCLILVIFTLFIKVDTNSIISSIFVIIFYIFITFLFIFIKKKLKKK